MPTLLTVSRDPRWIEEFQRLMPELALRRFPALGDRAEIDYAFAWAPEPGLLGSLPNLKVIFSLAAGVDHILRDPELPVGVPIIRMSDPYQSAMMAEYAVMAVLYRHRFLDRALADQAAETWHHQPVLYTPDTTVGVLGLGSIGLEIAARLSQLGFAVRGWSRTPKTVPGMACEHGPEGLARMLPHCHYVICVLPLTPETSGIIDRRFLASLRRGAHLVNLGRGGHVVEADLLEALDEGRLAGAFLDVFASEPLPKGHPFWRHPKIVVTPHMAGELLPRTAARSVIEGIRRHQAGLPLAHIYDPARGY